MTRTYHVMVERDDDAWRAVCPSLRDHGAVTTSKELSIRLARLAGDIRDRIKGAPTQDIWFWEHRVPEGQKAYSMTRPIRLEHLADCAAWWGGQQREGREESERAWKVSAEDIKARGYNLDIKNPHTVDTDHGDPAELLADLTAAEGDAASLRDQLKTILAEALSR